MEWTGIISLAIIVITVIFSYRGFSRYSFFNRYTFHVDKVLRGKEYFRLITSGLLHVGWLHLIVNMICLQAFSVGLTAYLSGIRYAIIYLASLVGGNLFVLFVYRRHKDYSAVGASGAVSGVMFASLALFPGMRVAPFGLFAIPGWLFCIIFVLISIYGVKSKRDNIGHEAHLAGAVIGMLTAIIMEPSVLTINIVPIMITLVLTGVFIFFIILHPHSLFIDNHYFKHHPQYTVDDRYNIEQRSRQEEVDRILEKIHKKGINSLTREEKRTLEAFSKSK